jgi:phospholipase/lecithinase/hemolysin
MKRSRLVAALLWCFSALAAIVSFGAAAAPPSYKIMHVFGDSLADSGNVFHLTRTAQIRVPPPNLYFQGRFSNGPTAPEVLWSLLNPGSKTVLKPVLPSVKLTQVDSVNFAFGGAGTGEITLTPGQFFVPGLKGQVATFVQLAKAKGLAKKALYLIVAGSNDYLFSPPGVTPDPMAVVGNIKTSIQRLYAAGARDFMVLNVPNLGKVPLVTVPDTPENQQKAAILSGLAAQHNASLAAALTQLRGQLAGATIRSFDLGPLTQDPPLDAALDDVLFDGAGFCLFAPAPPCAAGLADFNQGAGYFFWDALHPTAAMHKLLGEELFKALQQ